MSARNAGLRADYDLVVLGAGVSGLAAAHLASRSGRRTLVADTYPEPGGNHLSVEAGDFTFDIGAIFFFDGDRQFKMFPELREACVAAPYTMQRLRPGGMVGHYPFAFSELRDYTLSDLFSTGLSLLKGKLIYNEPRDSREFLDYYMGSYFREHSGLENFIQRFYALPSSQVSLAFARSRMGWVKELGSLRKRVAALAPQWRARAARRPSWPPPSALARPRTGFAQYYRRAMATLTAAGVEFRLKSPVTAIHREGGAVAVSLGSEVVTADRLISTFPVAMNLSLAGLQAEPGLQSSRLVTLGCSFEGRRGFQSVVLYNFDDTGAWKRLTMQSDYYGRAAGKEYMSVECTVVGPPPPARDLFASFREHAAQRGFLQGDLRLETVLHLDHAYPIFGPGAETSRDAALARLSAFGIESAGRQGNFDYIPSSNQAVFKIASRFANP